MKLSISVDLAVSGLIYIVVAGFVAQIGILTPYLAADYGVDATVAASQFSTLTTGFFLGTVLAFFLLDFLSVRLAIRLYALVVLATTATMIYSQSLILTSVLFAITGFCLGVSTCLAGMLVAKGKEGKAREMSFMGIDAAYNFGGLIFPALSAYVLMQSKTWELSLLIVASLTVWILFLSFGLKDDYEKEESPEGESPNFSPVWSHGVLVAGTALFLVIVAKYSIVLWLPQYYQEHLSYTLQEAAELVSTIFGSALVGTVLGVLIVARMRLVYFIVFVLTAGLFSSVLLSFSLGYYAALGAAALYGLAIAALYNVFIAYGLNYVHRPSHKHVSFVIICSGIAATIAPALSSAVVSSFASIRVVMLLSPLLYLAAITLLLVHQAFIKLSTISDQDSTRLTE